MTDSNVVKLVIHTTKMYQLVTTLVEVTTTHNFETGEDINHGAIVKVAAATPTSDKDLALLIFDSMIDQDA